MKYAIYVLVVEDTNESAERIIDLGASNVEVILEVETEEQAIDISSEMTATGTRLKLS